MDPWGGAWSEMGEIFKERFDYDRKHMLGRGRDEDAPNSPVFWTQNRWRRLRPDQKSAAIALGFTDASWDRGHMPDTFHQRWAQLSPVQVEAAMMLGYSRTFWDLRQAARSNIWKKATQLEGSTKFSILMAMAGTAETLKATDMAAWAATAALQQNMSQVSAALQAAGWSPKEPLVLAFYSVGRLRKPWSSDADQERFISAVRDAKVTPPLCIRRSHAAGRALQ